MAADPNTMVLNRAPLVQPATREKRIPKACSANAGIGSLTHLWALLSKTRFTEFPDHLPQVFFLLTVMLKQANGSESVCGVIT